MNHNEIALQGKVERVESVKTGEANGRKWTLSSVVLDDVKSAGTKPKESGKIQFTTFETDIPTGAVIGAVCRVTGREKEFNKDKEVRKFINVGLNATKDVQVIQAAPKPAASGASGGDGNGKDVEADDFPWEPVE